MLKDHRHICTGATCKVCRHLGRQRAARAAKHGLGSPSQDGPAQSPAATRRPAADHEAGH